MKKNKVEPRKVYRICPDSPACYDVPFMKLLELLDKNPSSKDKETIRPIKTKGGGHE